jgi:hypothetical protein
MGKKLNPHAGMGFFSGYELELAGAGTALPDRFLPVAISNCGTVIP